MKQVVLYEGGIRINGYARYSRKISCMLMLYKLRGYQLRKSKANIVAKNDKISKNKKIEKRNDRRNKWDKMRRITWPKESKIAVMLTFEFEAETLRISQLARQGKKVGAGELDQGMYGANEGIWRCLRMLDTHNVKATFFIPGYVIEKYEDTVKEIHLRGHEIAYHGYMHEADRETTREEEEAKMERVEMLIKRVTGRRPVGYRAPQHIA